MFNSDNISSALRPVGNESYIFVSNKFSLHNLFSFMLSKTGPAFVRISTFSLCETAIRNFVRHAADGDITGSAVLLDISLTKRNIDKLLFVNNVLSDVRLIDNHSKIIICRPTSGNGLIYIGSANFNDNRKYESGFLTSEPEVIKVATEAFDDLFNNSLPLICSLPMNK